MLTSSIRALCALLVLALAAGLPQTAAAQTVSPAQLKLAQQVVELSGSSRAFDRAIPSIFQQTYTTLVQANPDLQKDLTEVTERLIPEFDARKAEILQIVAQAYANKFTETELKELAAFYGSPIGKKLVAEHTAILQEAFQRTQEWGGKVSQELIERIRVEMKKRGHTI
jgi:hypothetical protein